MSRLREIEKSVTTQMVAEGMFAWQQPASSNAEDLVRRIYAAMEWRREQQRAKTFKAPVPRTSKLETPARPR